MKKRIWLIALACVLLLLTCSCSSREALIGRWETEIEDPTLGKIMMVYRFSEEGEIFLEQTEGDVIAFSIPFGEYEIKKNQMTIISDGASTVYTFSVSDTRLVLSGEGLESIYFRKLPAPSEG